MFLPMTIPGVLEHKLPLINDKRQLKGVSSYGLIGSYLFKCEGGNLQQTKD